MNQKLGTLSGVLLALLLCLTGCQKERFVPEEDLGYRHTAEFDEGSTYMSLAIRTNPPTSPTTDPASQPQTGTNDGKESQTGDEDFTTWQGDDIIENFAVYIVSEGIDKVQCIAGSVSDNKLATWNATKQELLLHPFRTPPVSKRIFAFFNIPTQYQKYLDEKHNNREEFLKRISEPIPYTGEKGITYSSGDAPTLEAFRPDSHIATKVIKNEPIGVLESMSSRGRVGDIKKPWEEVDFPNEFIDNTFNRIKFNELDFNKRSDRIFASGEKYNYLPEDNITKEEVENDRRNLVQVYTRRVLAQAVVTVEGSLVEQPNYSGLHGMQIVGLSFQALNFDPTFYPVAKTTKEGEWPGNSNTMSPLYDNKDNNSSRVNLSNYKWSYSDESFNSETLIVDRYFRSAHFVYDLPSIKELKQDDPLYAQKLMREREVSPEPPKHTTTFWGSCYVTESTQKWGTDESSGYTTSNTPFFAIVAYFDTESLPWSNVSKDNGIEKYGNDEKRYREAVKDLEEKLTIAEAELKELEKEQGEQGDDTEALWTEAQNKFEDWRTKVLEYTKKDNPKDENANIKRMLSYIVRWREKYRNGKVTNRAAFDKKIKSAINTLKSDVLKELKRYYKYKYDELFGEDGNGGLWKEIKDIDEKREGGGGIANRIAELKKEIARLKNEMANERNKVIPSYEWYPKDDVTNGNLEFYTPFIYEQGINRIFYSQVDHEFYLNYHEIPLRSRLGQRHTLTVDDEWLKDLKSKLPNGKDFPTESKGVSADVAVLPPSDELMGRLSQLLNGDIKEKDLSLAERRSMDFYLYGRVAPGLIQYFDSKKERTDRIDLQSGYVAWYSAKVPDRVVSYPCYLRYRKEDKNSISKGRLMMVYYAWLNPNTGDPSNSYASPVLRNNIYHMHITGFTKMGLSAIPFVPRVQEGNGYTFLHTPFDPDETVPGPGAPLIEATGSAGQASSQSMPRSASYTITF